MPGEIVKSLVLQHRPARLDSRTKQSASLQRRTSAFATLVVVELQFVKVPVESGTFQ